MTKLLDILLVILIIIATVLAGALTIGVVGKLLNIAC